jgi:hypothetical protein
MQSDESLRDELLAEVEAVAPILTEHAYVDELLAFSAMRSRPK